MKVTRKTNINISKAVKSVDSIKAKVGFFSSAKYEDGTPVAQIAIQNEYGIPQKKIPPRPFMRPTLDNQGKWKTIFRSGLKGAFKSGNFVKPFELVAITARADVKDSITKVTKPALSEATIKARQNRRGKKKQTKTGNKPLQDTNTMFEAVQYEVSK